MRKTTTEGRWNKFKKKARQIEKELTKSYQQSQKDSEEKAVNSIKRNSKYFFSYAKKFSSVKSGIGPFIDATK